MTQQKQFARRQQQQATSLKQPDMAAHVVQTYIARRRTCHIETKQ